MIHNVSIHVSGEQPLLCDLFGLPDATDAGLLCTNVRSTDGKRPIFIDASASTFFFPYHVIRFLEIPEGAMAGHRPRSRFDAEGDNLDIDGAADVGGRGARSDEDSRLAIAVGAPGGAGDEIDGDIEIDEDFLQRVRDI